MDNCLMKFNTAGKPERRFFLQTCRQNTKQPFRNQHFTFLFISRPVFWQMFSPRGHYIRNPCFHMRYHYLITGCFTFIIQRERDSTGKQLIQNNTKAIYIALKKYMPFILLRSHKLNGSGMPQARPALLIRHDG